MGLKLLHLSLHGLIRSKNLELGRDADTGGQTLYVIELIKGLASLPEVDQVDLVTRLIHDRKVSSEYSISEEFLAPGSNILRFPFGPRRYLRKELLWPYLDDLADHLVTYLQKQETLPNWIHAHYADAGYVGALVSRRLGIPLVFTGHSLGREKQRRLLATGLEHEQIEQIYSISRRIDAEELALAHSSLVVTSTHQESEHQYARYGNFSSKCSAVIPPGVDSTRFHALSVPSEEKTVNEFITPFLKNPSLPPLLAISRAVRRKNIPILVEAFGRSSLLRSRNNLILILGCRKDIRQLDKQQKEVFQQIFELVDRYNLYGSIAYPKQHVRDQIPSIYRWAAKQRGLFVNPALTEPFGLTLLESAASGLPIVATDDGGPRDIIDRCENGLLVDVTDIESMQDILEQAGSSNDQWKRWSDNGIEAVSRNFSWNAHVSNYLALVQQKISEIKPRNWQSFENQLEKPLGQQLLLLDLDSHLDHSETESLRSLRNNLTTTGKGQKNGLGILTGRSIKAARQRYLELHLPEPSVWICRTGTEIFYGKEEQEDRLWKLSISKDWDREKVEHSLIGLDQHINLQEDLHQGPFKISYILKEPGEEILPLIRKRLLKENQAAYPHLRCNWYLDILPLRASRTEAIRHLVLRWKIPLERIFVVASQQGDAELLKGLINTLVPAEHDPSLEGYRTQQRVYFASRSKIKGLIDGLNHYKFFSNK